MKQNYPFLTKLIAALSLGLTVVSCKLDKKPAEAAEKQEVKSLTTATSNPETPKAPEGENKEEKKEPKIEDLSLKFEKQNVLKCTSSELVGGGYKLEVTSAKDKLTGKVDLVDGAGKSEKVYDGEIKLQKVTAEKCAIVIQDVKDEKALKLVMIPDLADQLVALNDPYFTAPARKDKNVSVKMECEADPALIAACE